MDEVEKRLREVSDVCVKAYLEWHSKKKDAESREALQDAIHELRKVSARLEIEIAVSERDEMQSRPIPIPPHRATRKGGQDDDEGDNAGNFAETSHNAPGGGVPRQVLRRRSQHGGRSHGPAKSDE
jgi:hypothetical protein